MEDNDWGIEPIDMSEDDRRELMDSRINQVEERIKRDNRMLRDLERARRLMDEPKESSTPKEQWGVHESHCCAYHGCKYGDRDCPVYIGLVPDSEKLICEDCEEEY